MYWYFKQKTGKIALRVTWTWLTNFRREIESLQKASQNRAWGLITLTRKSIIRNKKAIVADAEEVMKRWIICLVNAEN